ncbi:hypothetical protein [Pedobacter sp.]|uniref:hypothetical protein n=1 Tax=Pedobacter sp. TaxID=1411316 RepID=UPI003BAA6848
MKILATSILLLICIYSCRGQTKGITPMHKFFQKYADSTIIIEYDTDSYEPHPYRIISRAGKSVNTFSYEPIDNSWKTLSSSKKNFPTQLWYELLSRKTLYKNRQADINIFFNLVEINPDTSLRIWKDISKFKPWQLLDDKSYPECSNIAIDAGYSIMHLITKKEIKTLIYYAPYYYEEQCPGNKNRQGIVGIERLFEKNFPKLPNLW